MRFHLDDRGVLRYRPWAERRWLVHGFSTRATGDFRGRSASESGELLGLAGPVVTLRQTHSGIVLRADGAVGPEEPRPEGDGLISASKGEAVAVRVADCLPLLLVDPETPAVAAVHAGWRGAAAGIAVRAVERMRAEYGSAPERLEALIGPCISAARFEVGPEVAELFPAAAVVRMPGRPKPHVDLTAAVRAQLAEAGLDPGRVFASERCSYSEPERFHSHRRDGASSGRMIAFVGLVSAGSSRRPLRRPASAKRGRANSTSVRR